MGDGAKRRRIRVETVAIDSPSEPRQSDNLARTGTLSQSGSQQSVHGGSAGRRSDDVATNAEGEKASEDNGYLVHERRSSEVDMRGSGKGRGRGFNRGPQEKPARGSNSGEMDGIRPRGSTAGGRGANQEGRKTEGGGGGVSKGKHKGSGGAMAMASPHQIQLNKQLVAYSSPDEVLRLVRINLSGFNLVNCTTALHRLAKMASGAEAAGRAEDLLARLLQRTVELVGVAGSKCPPQNLANALWACGRLLPAFVADGQSDMRADTGSLVEAARVALLDPARLQQFKGQHMSNIGWSVAKLGGEAAVAFFNSFGAAVAEKAWVFNGQELSMAAWALATSGEVTGVSEIVDAARALDGGGVRALDPQQIATLAWALAKLGIGDDAIFGEIAAAAVKPVSAGSFNSHDLASLAWAFGRREGSANGAEALLEAIGGVVQSRLAEDPGGAFSPRHLSMILWAFAKVGVRCPATTLAITAAASRRVAELGPRDLADIVWAVSFLGLPAAEGFVDAAGRSAKDRSGDFNSQEMLKFLGAFRRAGGDEVVQRALATEQRQLEYDFPALGTSLAHVTLLAGAPGARQGCHGGQVVGAAGDPQRADGRATGTALWEGSFVLAEWLSRLGPQLHLAAQAPGGVGDLVPHKWQLEQKTLRKRATNTKSNLTGVELGAGLGLPSIVAARLGLRMVATDGDDAVLELLHGNAERSGPPPCCEGSLAVKKLLWGPEASTAALGLGDSDGNSVKDIGKSPDLLLAADVVYANDREALTEDLVTTMLHLCGEDTLILVANVRRFPVNHPKGEGRFFARLEHLFERAELPQHCLHKDFQRTGTGSCVIHALRRRRTVVGGEVAPTSSTPIAQVRPDPSRRLKRKTCRQPSPDTSGVGSVETKSKSRRKHTLHKRAFSCGDVADSVSATTAAARRRSRQCGAVARVCDGGGEYVEVKTATAAPVTRLSVVRAGAGSYPQRLRRRKRRLLSKSSARCGTAATQMESCT
eukprot:TRINITY_DN49431_c0_g1_i1.p1 TRINITY_DN49431_c0_g1~~TRINITY_DN49431_c0_g1_i1.p1  ORF type:complete len:988 (+),score=167.95 TRINITY_DN49431_c0_g1_i1:50-3013(+)